MFMLSISAISDRRNLIPMGNLEWRKARRSANNGACVELAPTARQILIRDSKTQNGPTIAYSKDSWKLFVASAKTGHFDPERL
jgi:Domain of unknown function (DUF397)